MSESTQSAADPIATPGELTDRERAALEALLFRLADDEFVLAERYTEWQIYAPTLEADLALANVAQDEFGHARLWYDLLCELGYSEAELVWERPPEAWHHSTLVERPFPEGDWADVIVRSYLYDTAERIRLAALEDSAYLPLADRIRKVQQEERYHREHTETWLERLTVGEGRDRVAAAVDRLFPHALSLFAPGPRRADIEALGLRTEPIAEQRRSWLDTVVSVLESLDVSVPEPADASPSEAIGRNGCHTDAWDELHDAFTRTYHELGGPDPVSLRAGGGGRGR
ncbi:MAG: 1,2-phenylacetyl-CoA epoxidase subunit PaaC [Halobacteriota archaeon]